MNIPDIEDFRRLEKKVSSTQLMMKELLNIIGDPVLTIEDIADREGCCRSQMNKERWRFPNFGQSDFATGRKRWRLSTYLQWRERDELERKKEWDLMKLSDRDKIVVGQF